MLTNKTAEYDNRKFIRNSTCTTSSYKGHYVVLAYGIIYHIAIFCVETGVVGPVAVTIGKCCEYLFRNHDIQAL